MDELLDDVGLQRMAEGMADARRQSVEEVVTEMLRFVDRPAAEAFLASEPRALGFGEAANELGNLPTVESLAQAISPFCARITTNLGCVVYAFNWDSIDPGMAWFVGVHCFPGEPIDLDRQQRFVITDLGDRAAILVGRRYLDALERRMDAFVMEVFEIVLESAPNLAQA